MATNPYIAKTTLYSPEGKVLSEIESILDFQGGGINAIESAVTGLRNSVLPKIERMMLENEEKAFIEKKKMANGGTEKTQ